jgi:uncharacterized oligopeptide transporter (OPT) family protein
MTAVLGVFMLTQMRKLMIIDWKLPFPSGTASGIMLTSFHTAVSGAHWGHIVALLSSVSLDWEVFCVVHQLLQSSTHTVLTGVGMCHGHKRPQHCC